MRPLSSENVVLYELGEICTDQAHFMNKNSSKQICFNLRGQQGMDFFPKGSIIMDYI